MADIPTDMAMDTHVPGTCRLRNRAGRIEASIDGDSWVSVSVRYARPLTTRREIVVFDDDSNEFAFLTDLDVLDEPSRKVAATALRERYHLPQIKQVRQVDPRYGTYYWSVVTDKGARDFALKTPGENLTWLSLDHIILRDTLGNRYEIESIAGLDRASRRRLQSIL